MASIGGITVTTWRGSLDPTGQTVEEITRPGVSGHAYATRGKRAMEGLVRTIIDVTSAAAIETTRAAVKALQGTSVTVIDGVGNTINNVVVEQVRIISTRAVASAVGGINGTAATHIMEVEWQLKRTAIT